MSAKETLARARADIERGDVGMARRRLTSLSAARPADFEVRRALRDACRAGRDPAEAGRWGFVLEDAEEGELEAFRRSRGHHPRELARAIRWSVDDEGEGPVGTARLRELRAEREAGRRDSENDSSRPHGCVFWDDVGCFLLAAAVMVLAALGLFQLTQIVRGWLG